MNTYFCKVAFAAFCCIWQEKDFKEYENVKNKEYEESNIEENVKKMYQVDTDCED